MATVFMAIGTAVTSAFGAGGAAAGTAAASAGAATAGAAASGGISALGALAGGLGAAQALTSIAQGRAMQDAANQQAAQLRVQAAQEDARGSAQAEALAREYAALSGQQAVVQAAYGLNPGVGTPASVGRATQALAERNISTARLNAGQRAAAARAQSRALLSEGRASLVAGTLGAAQAGLSTIQLIG